MPESPKAAAAFREYCALGPGRSLAKLAEKIGKSSGYTRQLETWSSAFGWVARAGQYDAERDAEKLRKREEAIDAMNERHALIGTTQQARAIKQIEELITAKNLGSQASVQLLKLALDVERIARGAATERAELTGKDGGPLAARTTLTLDLAKLRDASPEQLAALRALAVELKEKE